MPCYNPLSGISDKEWASLCCEAKNRMEHELNKVTAMLCKTLFILEDVCQFPDDPELMKWWKEHQKFDLSRKDL
jgi:hypothetical protein